MTLYRCNTCNELVTGGTGHFGHDVQAVHPQKISPAIDAWNDAHPDEVHRKVMENRGKQEAMEMSKLKGGREVPDDLRDKSVALAEKADLKTASDMLKEHGYKVCAPTIIYWRDHPRKKAEEHVAKNVIGSNLPPNTGLITKQESKVEPEFDVKMLRGRLISIYEYLMMGRSERATVELRDVLDGF